MLTSTVHTTCVVTPCMCWLWAADGEHYCDTLYVLTVHSWWRTWSPIQISYCQDPASSNQPPPSGPTCARWTHNGSTKAPFALHWVNSSPYLCPNVRIIQIMTIFNVCATHNVCGGWNTWSCFRGIPGNAMMMWWCDNNQDRQESECFELLCGQARLIRLHLSPFCPGSVSYVFRRWDMNWFLYLISLFELQIHNVQITAQHFTACWLSIKYCSYNLQPAPCPAGRRPVNPIEGMYNHIKLTL